MPRFRFPCTRCCCSTVVSMSACWGVVERSRSSVRPNCRGVLSIPHSNLDTPLADGCRTWRTCSPSDRSRGKGQIELLAFWSSSPLLTLNGPPFSSSTHMSKTCCACPCATSNVVVARGLHYYYVYMMATPFLRMLGNQEDFYLGFRHPFISSHTKGPFPSLSGRKSICGRG